MILEILASSTYVCLIHQIRKWTIQDDSIFNSHLLSTFVLLRLKKFHLPLQNEFSSVGIFIFVTCNVIYFLCLFPTFYFVISYCSTTTIRSWDICIVRMDTVNTRGCEKDSFCEKDFASRTKGWLHSSL